MVICGFVLAIVFFLLWPHEPSPFIAPTMLAATALIYAAARYIGSQSLRRVAYVLLPMGLGFGWAQTRTYNEAAHLALWLGAVSHQPHCGQRHRFYRHCQISTGRHIRLACQSFGHADIRHIDYANGTAVFIADVGRAGKASIISHANRH